MNDDFRWQQVLARVEPERAFVYAVHSTGIYCRPTCPSRRPLPANVSFYDSGTDAEAAGYRPCLRCTPERPASTGDDRDAVVAACRAMVEGGGPLPATELCRLTGLSPRGLSRAFAAIVGTSARAFGNAVRTGTARRLLRAGEPVSEAIFGSGFGSVRGFYETAAPTLGMTPSVYAGGGAEETLAWTSVPTPVGWIMAVAGARGLCAVRIGEHVGSLLEEVREEFPSATLVPEHEALAEVAAALAGLAVGRRPADALPLDLRGTAFQARVWTALTRIPVGQTRSYTEIAAELGQPAAARAVAGACASNGLALVVPCHRVVRTDGALGGFRWGLTVKRALLDAERGTGCDDAPVPAPDIDDARDRHAG